MQLELHDTWVNYIYACGSSDFGTVAFIIGILGILACALVPPLRWLGSTLAHALRRLEAVAWLAYLVSTLLPLYKIFVAFCYVAASFGLSAEFFRTCL